MHEPPVVTTHTYTKKTTSGLVRSFDKHYVYYRTDTWTRTYQYTLTKFHDGRIERGAKELIWWLHEWTIRKVRTADLSRAVELPGGSPTPVIPLAVTSNGQASATGICGQGGTPETCEPEHTPTGGDCVPSVGSVLNACLADDPTPPRPDGDAFSSGTPEVEAEPAPEPDAAGAGSRGGTGKSCPTRKVYGPFHRSGETRNQNAEVARQMEESGEAWGRIPRGGHQPTVQALRGPLPSGDKGVEYCTFLPPHPNQENYYTQWGASDPGVRLEGDYAKVSCVVTKNTY